MALASIIANTCPAGANPCILATCPGNAKANCVKCGCSFKFVDNLNQVVDCSVTPPLNADPASAPASGTDVDPNLSDSERVRRFILVLYVMQIYMQRNSVPPWNPNRARASFPPSPRIRRVRRVRNQRFSNGGFQQDNMFDSQNDAFPPSPIG